MKHLLLAILIMLSISAFAQQKPLIWFQATEYVVAENNGLWEKPAKSKTKVSINLNSDNFFVGIIMVYAKDVMTLSLNKYFGRTINGSSKITSWGFIDNAQDTGTCKLFQNDDGTYQLGINYDDGFKVCYNMKPI